jgi:hypothetical protein
MVSVAARPRRRFPAAADMIVASNEPARNRSTSAAVCSSRNGCRLI